MIFKRKSKTHDEMLKELSAKYKVAKAKHDERIIKLEILKLYLPFQITLKFNKIIVLFSIVAIIIYTVAAILLQKYTFMELSPTLTTCVYAFFGTELLGLAGIKMCDTRFATQENNRNYSSISSSQEEISDGNAVG